MGLLRADRVYIPSGGVNTDSEGLTVREFECVDAENLRFTPDEVVTRAGDRRIATNTPSGDPIIHQHTYKDPDGEEQLIGFTKNNIWRYTETSGAWLNILESLLIDGCDATTDWTTTGSVIVATSASAVQGGKMFFSDLDSNGEYLRLTLPTALDLSEYLKFKFYYIVSVIIGTGVPRDLTVSFYDSSSVLIQSATLTDFFDADNLDTTWQLQEIDITLPGGGSGWTDVKRIDFTPEIVPGYSITWFLDYLFVDTPITDDLTFWSVTNFIDNSEGITMIAAGSAPPNPGEEEADINKRVLFYYDTDDEIFKTLAIQKRRTITNEETGETVPASNTVVTGSAVSHAGDGDWVSMVGEGLIIFYTAERGLLGTAVAILDGDVDGSGNPGYRISPANPAIVSASSSSWVLQDGTAWSLDFLDTGGWEDQDILIEYVYFQTFTFKPRFVTNFHNHLLMIGTVEDNEYYPWRVRYSRVRRMGEFAQLDYLDIIDADHSAIRGIAKQGFFQMVYKEDSTARIYHVEGEIPQAFQETNAPFNHETVWADGFYATRTLQTYNNIQYFLGKDDVYGFDGNRRFSITRNNQEGYYRVRREIFTLLNQGKVLNCLGAINQFHKQYWLGIVEAGQTYPTLFYIYDILRDIWFKYRYDPITSIGAYRTQPATAIEDLVGTIAEQNWTFITAQFEGMIANPTLAFAAGDVRIVDERLVSSGGYTSPQTGNWVPGSDIPSYLITRDFIASDLEQPERITQARLRAAGDSVDISISVNQHRTEDEFKQKQTIPLQARLNTENYWPDMNGYHHRYCLAFAKAVRFKWLQPFLVQNRNPTE